MKTKLIVGLSLMLLASARAQVQVLPPDFTLFGKTSADYLAEYDQALFPLSTNEDFSFPKAVPSATDPVYFLHRPSFGLAAPSVTQTYFVPDNVYVYLAVFYYANDNVNVEPPLTIEQLKDGLKASVDEVIDLYAIIDGVAVTNLFAYRTASPVFSVFFPTNDNFYSLLLQKPYEGLDDPVVAEGFLLMLAPLPVGVHDFQTGATVSDPLGYVYKRHYQIVVYHTNNPPVADASATASRVISPNNHDAIVVLDGSRSSDPDHDTLTFSWLEQGMVIGQGDLSTNRFGVGLHEVSLVVSDGELSATNTVMVKVLTPCAALGELAVAVEASKLPRKETKPLVEELREACAAFERAFKARRHDRQDHLKHAFHELGEFQEEVRGELGRTNPTLAALLIDGAQEIIDAVAPASAHHEVGGDGDRDDQD